MLDAASSADMAAAAGLSTSIPPLATGLAAVTVAAALPEANMHPPSSIGVNVTATAGARQRNMCTGLVGWHRWGRQVMLSSSCSPRKGSTLRYWNCAARGISARCCYH
jgi:hypothetical protein